MANTLNFTFKYVESVDGKYGTIDDNETMYNGLIGMLQKNEIDSAISDLSLSKDRAMVIDYTDTFFSSKST